MIHFVVIPGLAINHPPQAHFILIAQFQYKQAPRPPQAIDRVSGPTTGFPYFLAPTPESVISKRQQDRVFHSVLYHL
jgi:hypothetical protein